MTVRELIAALALASTDLDAPVSCFIISGDNIVSADPLEVKDMSSDGELHVNLMLAAPIAWNAETFVPLDAGVLTLE